MSSSTTTLRLRPELRDQINRLAKRHRRSFSETAQDLMEEALRLRLCPGVYFTDEVAGRIAKVSGTGLAVWEVIRDYLDLRQDEAALRAQFPHLSPAQIQACLLYYGKYREEIDESIAENRGLTWPAIQERLGSLVRQA